MILVNEIEHHRTCLECGAIVADGTLDQVALAAWTATHRVDGHSDSRVTRIGKALRRRFVPEVAAA